MTEQEIKEIRLERTEDAIEMAEHLRKTTGQNWRAVSTDETWREWKLVN